ncbi:hypothetical protein HDF26_003805 [Pedobacter cryoconitis]|uniref:hypothetical protein n=1 Tax=Pedobacter cryoconitis TaxID=188932 RepID=UPI0016200DF8|nr:hypothetical protein [Pedobacter cryoconitis]MBB6273345.1 hypothetical protein [Pedobacter cryoconitis]
MKKNLLLTFCLLLLNIHLNAQWQSPVSLDNLNTWSSKSGFISWYNHTNNGPKAAAYGNGLQLALSGDERFGAQIVIPTFTDQLLFRRKSADAWNGWNEVWHSGNLEPLNFMQKKVATIKDALSVNDFKNGYTFAYATSGTPWNGALMSFGGLNGNYDCQFSTDYGPGGGSRISFRTQNGDSNTVLWNPWNELYHAGNINKADISLVCKDLLANGNLWAKEIQVASNNPWPDYVFEPAYEKLSLTELESFVKINKRLPEIPSATEVMKDGINVGDMNAKLLKKIEELTLYVIELKHEVDNLKKDTKQK